ncbi:MAG: 3',5'-cyclic-nucleotide phosphodiesterase [Thermoanaerobaculia bacterium]|nr:3',5'-cyclic-nucleotide phosphodiesterase [Thermoanaerobaculia bacterium]
MTSLLINGLVALDAGCLTRALTIERQRAIRAVVLTHSHVDHTASLPFFIENIFPRERSPIDIWASEATIYALRKNLFNNAAWPDFTQLPNHLLPTVRFHTLTDERPVEIEGVRFTPIPVDHLVPTYGFLIEQGAASVIWSSDTGPTTRLWEIANQVPGLGAVCIETTFDSSLQDLADASYHLTPRTLREEIGKLERPLPVLVHHLKPPYVEPIRREITAWNDRRVAFLQQAKIYRF